MAKMMEPGAGKVGENVAMHGSGAGAGAANVGHGQPGAGDVLGDSQEREGRTDVSGTGVASGEGSGRDVVLDGSTLRQFGRMESDIAWLVKGQKSLETKMEKVFAKLDAMDKRVYLLCLSLLWSWG